MKVTKRIGQGLKYLVDFPRWMGWVQIKDSAKELRDMAKILLSPREAKRKESFEEAVIRLNLSDSDIKQQTSRHLGLFLIFFTTTLTLLVYSFYLLFTHHYQGFLLGIFVSVLAASLSFREHFYYFQMKTRRLGCTFQDWVDFILRRARK